MALPRGFKAEAERTAQRLRAETGVGESESIDLLAAADCLGVQVISATDLVPIERLREIERLQAFAFSACTFEINERQFIVYNPLRSEARRASDIAHEFAHIILQHDLTEIQYLDGIPFRTCRPDEEQQATTLGGTLLLPRPVLLEEARRGATVEQVARKFGVTREMAQFRWNTTGVARQTAAAKAARNRPRA